MPSYLWYKQCLDEFIESEHPRDEDGKFTSSGQENSNKHTISSEERQKRWDKITSIANKLKQQGFKVKGVRAAATGSQYLEVFLPTKNKYEWAKVSFRSHDSDKNFDILLEENATQEDFIKEFERVKQIFAESEKGWQAHNAARNKQYK